MKISKKPSDHEEEPHNNSEFDSETIDSTTSQKKSTDDSISMWIECPMWIIPKE